MIEYVTAKPVRDFSLISELAACLAIYACTSQTMFAPEPAWLADELYQDITMGLYERSIKERWKHPFSGCAYLCNWVLEGCGFSNVDDIGRTGKADNPLSKLAWHKLSTSIKVNDVFASGDMIQIGDDLATHIYTCISPNEVIHGAYTQILGGHYGQEGIVRPQGEKGYEKPIGGEIKSLLVSNFNQHRQDHGNRPARRVLRLSRLFEATPHLSPFKVPKPLAMWLQAHQERFKEVFA